MCRAKDQETARALLVEVVHHFRGRRDVIHRKVRNTRILDPRAEQYQRCVQLELVEAFEVEFDGGEDESINEISAKVAQD